MISLRDRAAAELEIRRRRAAARKAEDEALLAECRDDPALFCAEFLGDTLWSKQIDICNAVARSPITVIPAGRAVGKSFILARLALWWIYTREHSLVLTTGPDHRQVVHVLWAEIKKAIRPRHEDGVRVHPRRGLDYDFLSDGQGSPQRLVVKDGTRWGAVGFACKAEEGMSGYHSPELLVIVDESSGVPEPVWESIFGASARRYVFAGNPLKYDSRFRELFEAVPGSSDMAAVTISSLDHPDAGLEDSPVGAVSAAWLRQMADLQGIGSPWWKSNVEGQFPGIESVRFIPDSWLNACTRPEIPADEVWRGCVPGIPWIGVDVGGGVGGDRSVCVVRNHKQLLEVFASEWHGVIGNAGDPLPGDARHRLEPVVIELARKWGVPPSRVIYDQGGLGRSFGNYLARAGFDGAIGSFGSASGGILYRNRRTANAFAFRRRIDPNRKGHVPFYCGGIPLWPKMREELAAIHGPTLEEQEGQVKQAIEGKETLAGRLKHSPDLIDALFLSHTYID